MEGKEHHHCKGLKYIFLKIFLLCQCDTDEEDTEYSDDESTTVESFGMEHSSSVESSTLTGPLSIKTEEMEEGGEVKVSYGIMIASHLSREIYSTKGDDLSEKKYLQEKIKKKKIRYDENGDKKVDRRKVGGVSLFSIILIF